MRFRVVLIGLGHAGSQLHLPALRRLADVEVVAVCDTDPARFPAVGPTTAVDDPAAAIAVPADAVVIATPPSTHAALATAAIQAGRHVYVEKPMTETLADADAIVDRALTSGLTVQVGFAYRFHPLWERLIALVHDGRLSLPFAAEGAFDAPAGRGWDHPVLSVGSHHLDLLILLAGAAPTEIEVVDGRRLLARWADGSTLDGTYAPGPGDDWMSVRFRERTVHLDRRRGRGLRGAGPRSSLPVPALVRARPGTTGWERSFERALRSFVDRSSAGLPAVPGPSEGRRAVALGIAMSESTARGRAVQVRL